MKIADLKISYDVNMDMVIVRDNSDNSIVIKPETYDENDGGLYDGETGEDIDSPFDALYVKDEDGDYVHATVKDILEGNTIYVYYYTGSVYEDDNHMEASLDLDADISIDDEVSVDELGTKITAEALGLSDKEYRELKNNADDFEDVIRQWASEGEYGFVLFDSVEEFGAENSDNSFREDYDSDEEFGEFLVGAFLNSGDFCHKFTTGKVLTFLE